MSNLEVPVIVGSVVSASFLIGCILGEALFRALRDRREAAYDRSRRETDRTCRECYGDCDRELGGE